MSFDNSRDTRLSCFSQSLFSEVTAQQTLPAPRAPEVLFVLVLALTWLRWLFFNKYFVCWIESEGYDILREKDFWGRNICQSRGRLHRVKGQSLAL